MRWAVLLLVGGVGTACLFGALSAMGKKLETEQALALAEQAKAEAMLMQMQALITQIDMNLAFQDALLDQIKLTNFLVTVIVVWAAVLVLLLILIIVALIRRQNKLEELLWKQLSAPGAESTRYRPTLECLPIGGRLPRENQYASLARKSTGRHG